MRICFVVPELSKASGWRSLSVGVVKAIHQYTSCAVTVVVSKSDEASAQMLLPAVRRIVVPRTQTLSLQNPFLWIDLVATWFAARVQSTERVDLVHSLEGFPTGLVGSWIAEAAEVPHVITGVGTYSINPTRSWLSSRLYRAVLRKSDAICCISDGTASRLRNTYPMQLRKKPLFTVLLGTDFAYKVPATVALRNRSRSEPMVLSVGSVKPRKGYDLSISAFGRFRSIVPGAQYLIVGSHPDPRYIQTLHELIWRRGIEGVEFLGEVEPKTLHQLYSEASIFLLTPKEIKGKFEGFGLVYLEAGAYGLPVVATRSGGVPSAVLDGRTGILADEDDEEAVVRALCALAADPDLASSLGRGNRRWAETLTWKRFAEEQTEVYQRLGLKELR